MSRVVSIGLTILVAVGVAGAVAHEGATGVIGERMDGMKAAAEELKALTEMIKSPADFDRARVVQASQTVAKHAERIPALFPEGSMHPPSEASPEIWNDWDWFVSIAMELQEAAQALEIEATGEGPVDLRAGFNVMLETCKSCHEGFRIER